MLISIDYRGVKYDGVYVGAHTQEHKYAKAWVKPNYPVPAKRMRSFEYWRNLGEVSALNAFDIEVVQRLNRYR